MPLICVLPTVAWCLHQRPSRLALARAARGMTGGLLIAGIGLPILRATFGPSLPGFVPPEESAAPGLLLGVGAGILEEAVFRLGLLAFAFVIARRLLPAAWARVFVVVLTGLAFALSHELGPGVGPFEARFFLTRFLIPGCLMSALFFRPGPAFLVSLHSAAHVGIALLFNGEHLK